MDSGKVQGKRILLVDDEDGVRQTLKLLLRMDEHTVSEAVTGTDALELFLHGRFDLVITDYAMPKMRGDELAVNIKRLAPSQPIIMITAHAILAGKPGNPVDALLKKPFAFEDLRRSIAEVLSARQ